MALNQVSGFEWTFNWDKLESRLDTLEVDLYDAAEEGLDNIGKAAVAEVRKHIENRGTPWSKYRYEVLRQGNSAGRNDTGRMKGAVDYEVIDDSVIFGWIYDQEKYFLYQEGEIPNRITPMFALRDAATLVEKIGPGLVGISVSKALRKAGF
jgi:hypothetical protein